ncbi:hypothetical protein WICMUC_005192 [Wickerhamomyces mucosus]|uniref:Transcriptional regulatory protein RXT2 N-terminal domain-containing protein n=1 Tax=Wickerhamomyces mucosus TaxID=1378264 RepID=A0A9P8P9I9_9ASCO|nr:hypothetical protein WICMUC_005192 [Wickerhamomyces mucosus]
MIEIELPEKDLLKYIRLFTDRIKGKHVEEYEEEIDGETSNRGNKLKRGSEKVHRDHIDGLNNDNTPVEVIEYNRVKRAVFKRRRLDTYNHEEYQDFSGDEEDEIYQQIDIENILAPISDPTQLVTRDSISRTYKSEILKRLAQQSVEIIEKEQNFVIKLSSLLDLFLGESSNQILEDDLQLPPYEPLEISNELSNKNSVSSGITEQNEENVDLSKRVTRRQSVQEVDPFFALPNFKVDYNVGLDPKIADTARQITQIAVQRNEEYIRNLSKLGNSLMRAQTLKEKLLDWAKEMNGDPDESDIYLKENPQATAKDPKNKDDQSGSNTDTTPVPDAPKGRGGRRRNNA